MGAGQREAGTLAGGSFFFASPQVKVHNVNDASRRLVKAEATRARHRNVSFSQNCSLPRVRVTSFQALIRSCADSIVSAVKNAPKASELSSVRVKGTRSLFCASGQTLVNVGLVWRRNNTGYRCEMITLFNGTFNSTQVLHKAGGIGLEQEPTLVLHQESHEKLKTLKRWPETQVG